MYIWLGLFTSLALLLAVYTIASIVAGPMGTWVERASLRWDAGRRANAWFALRIAPATVAIGFVVFISWPAFLAFEPRQSNETIGAKLSIVAALAGCGIAWSLVRVAKAWLDSRRVTAEWMRRAQPAFVDGVDIPVYRFDHPFPVMAVSGILRPRLFIANHLLDSLDPAEIAAAVAHEMGHVTARDNLRRVWLTFCPDPWKLDARWMAASEDAADLFAVRRGARLPLDLASALIKVARATPAGITFAFPLYMQLLASDSETGLSGRVHRLIEFSDEDASPHVALWPVAAFVPLGLIAYWTSASTLHAAHEVLESFVRFFS